MNIELLLANADDQRPTLEGGLPEDTTSTAVSRGEGSEAHDFLDFSDDPNSLPAQRWAVIAPEGAEGDRLLELINPLK